MRKSFWREVCCSVSCSFDWVWQSTAGKIVSHSLISANSRVEGDFWIFPPVSQHKTPHSKSERMFSRQNYLVEHRNFSLNIAPLHRVVPDDCFNLFSTTIIVVVHIHLTHSAPPLVSSTARVVSSESWRSTSSHSLHMSLDKITTHRVVVVMQPLRNKYSARWWECKNGSFHPQYLSFSIIPMYRCADDFMHMRCW